MYQGNSTAGGIEEYIATGSPKSLPMTIGPYATQIFLRFVSDGGTNFAGYNLTYMSGNLFMFY